MKQKKNIQYIPPTINDADDDDDINQSKNKWKRPLVEEKKNSPPIRVKVISG